MRAMYTLGRFLQAVGLVLVPVALYIGIGGHAADEQGSAGIELAILAGGVVVFLLGRRLEAKAS